MKIDLTWNDLLIKVSKASQISYSELKRISIYEFFITLQNIQKSIEDGNDTNGTS